MDDPIPIIEYIGLGSLVSYRLGNAETGPDSWHEVSQITLHDSGVTATLHAQRTAISVQNLLRARLLRAYSLSRDNKIFYRLYYLPDNAGRGSVGARKKGLRADLENLVSVINVSEESWNAQGTRHSDFEPWATTEPGSMFYVFNTLPSPNPDPSVVHDCYTRTTLSKLLDTDCQLPGLKSTLYPYQARSAAAMIQQESTTKAQLDPRYEARRGPDGDEYYFMPRELSFSKSKPMYESSCGGILAETMGYGKTVICLATILTTKSHLPKIPAQFFPSGHISKSTPTLLDTALRTAGNHSLPTKAHFDRLRRKTGEQDFVCLRRLDDLPPAYFIPETPPRSARRAVTPEPRRMILCSGTIIVVPRNLIQQWTSEIRKHVQEDEDGLKVLVLDSPGSEIPGIETLRHYDIVLFSKSRFQQEIKHGTDRQGRNRQNTNLSCYCPYIGATRIRDCTCLKTEDIYLSPLQQLHWLRIIIDEGHEFSSATSNAVMVASKLVTAERRWIVSGTPARDRLYGVEVDISAHVDDESLQVSSTASSDSSIGTLSPHNTQSLRSQALQNRMLFSKEEEAGSTSAAKSVGTLVQHFLKIRPWTHDHNEPKVDWDDHIYKHEDFRSKTYSSFSSCFRRVMESVVIKTRPEDVERDIILPPLIHKTVVIEPAFYDKLTANLFVLFLTSNAVCSERSDQDYLFHKSSAKPRHQLITNLRQSNFFWTGFSSENVASAVETSLKYLSKEDIICTDQDRVLLLQCIEFAQIVLGSAGWQALSDSHEVGMFLNSWPGDSSENWALTTEHDMLMLGAGPLGDAQRYVDERLFEEDPIHGLDSAGKLALVAVEAANLSSNGAVRVNSNDAKAKIGVPSSAVQSEPPAKRSALAQRTSTASRDVEDTALLTASSEARQTMHTTPVKDLKRKKKLDLRDLPQSSPLHKTTLIGTVSAKLSYLIDQVSEHHKDEKILVFYDGENAAYYLAQCLDIMHVKHLIYAKSLSNDLKSKYVVSFDTDDTIRVLLMDIRSGAFGLNINKASRVYFINPVCRPSTEAQAIKRAHRIGQTKPVHVETLVLKGTIEEAIFERSKTMTQTEHSSVSQLDDDQGVAQIIQNAQILPMTAEEGKGLAQMAPLRHKLQIFGRPGRGDTSIKGIDKDLELFDGESPPKKARKTVASRAVLSSHARKSPSGRTTYRPNSSLGVTSILTTANDITRRITMPDTRPTPTPLLNAQSIFGP